MQDKTVVKKPEDWPCNDRECYLERVTQALTAFRENPNFATREVLVSLAAAHDYSQINSIGRYRISLYEIQSLNELYFYARFYNLTSLLMFVYIYLSKMVILDRCVENIDLNINSNENKLLSKEWKSYSFLNSFLAMFYCIYDDYRNNKEGDLADSIERVVGNSFNRCNNSEGKFWTVHNLVVLISDLSFIIGTKVDQEFQLSRDSLRKLFAFESMMLKQSEQMPGKRPLSSQLKIQISNFILKSRNGYNRDYICKYISPKNLSQSIEQGEIWINEIKNLNDPAEGSVVQAVLRDDSWIRYEWAKYVDARPMRNYYVACFSKSIGNKDTLNRYGGFMLGYKNDRLSDLLAPISLHTVCRNKSFNTKNKELFSYPQLSQMLSFDVLYGEEPLKEELLFLCSVINLFEMTDKEKHSFFESIVQYWLYSAKVLGCGWESERERRYVLFMYPEYNYSNARLEDGYLKIKSTAYMFPDFIEGDNVICREGIKKRIDEKRYNISNKKHFFCKKCFNFDFDLPNRNIEKCPICNASDFEIIE